MRDLLRKIASFAIVLILLVTTVVVIKISIPKYRTWRANVAQRDALQAEVDSIREQITQTKRNIDRFKTSPYFVERLARMNHRVADNEIVFIFQ